jgi:hypothetical protein
LNLLFWWLVTISAAAWGQAPDCPSGAAGRWSVQALDLCTSVNGTVPDLTRSIRVPSPDGQKIIRIEKDQWWLIVTGQKIPLKPHNAYVTYPAEIAWAPDSKAFYVTQSDGNIAGFHTIIYQLEGKQIRSLDLNRLLHRDFDRRHKCVFYDGGKDVGEDPNIGGLQWIDGSRSLLFIAEIPPHSLCPEPGYFGGYLVSIPDRRIMSRYSPQQLMTDWATVLGERLRGDFSSLSQPQRLAVP